MTDNHSPFPTVGAAAWENMPAEVIKHLANAEAALMLVECLMHVLVEQRIFKIEQMVEAVESAIATKRQMVEEHQQPQIASVALGMLNVIANSLAAGSAKAPGEH
jgi:hypothetical protein